jgi:hypothetical protein
MVKCIKNINITDITDKVRKPGEFLRVDLSRYITIGKNYYIQSNPCSEYVYNIIDDRGNLHDIRKDMFIEINLLRQEKLDLLGL